LLALLVFQLTAHCASARRSCRHQAARNASAVTPAGSKVTPELKPAEGASIEIISPKADQVFNADTVPLRFKLTKGKHGHHVHAYVDGELMGMFTGRQGTLNGIKPGLHVLELRVVTADHQTELDARDRVEFVVQ
jgi:hypothetical protein